MSENDVFGGVGVEIPTREELHKKYVIEKISIYNLSCYYHRSTKTVRNWLKNHKIDIRSWGGHKPQKYQIDVIFLTGLVSCGYTHDQIGYLLNIKRGCLIEECQRLEISTRKKAKPLGQIFSFQTYKHRVHYWTNKTYRKNKSTLDPLNLRGRYNHHIDHIQSVRECYDRKISVEDCSRLDNLRMLPWRENISRKPFKVQLENNHVI